MNRAWRRPSPKPIPNSLDKDKAISGTKMSSSKNRNRTSLTCIACRHFPRSRSNSTAKLVVPMSISTMVTISMDRL